MNGLDASDLRLGIVAGDAAFRAPDGRLMLSFAIGRLLEVLRKEIPNSRVCLPVLTNAQQGMTYPLNFPAEAIVELPPLASTLTAQRYYLPTRRSLRAFAQSVDLLFVRVPFQLPLCLLNLNKPKVVHVISNPYEVVRASTDYQGIRRLLALGFASHSERVMRRLVAEPRTRVVTNGNEMWKRLGCRDGRVAVSSNLYSDEMRPPKTFVLNRPPRILFVGYIRPEKGLHTLLDAFTQLRQRREITLTLVGGSDRSSGAESVIRRRIEESPYHADISVKGMMEFGEDLFDLYRSHDVFVLPSLSEGTPRTLVEARCFGCPVVATNVGGIPTSMEHNHDGLLVEPGQPEALTIAIESILDNDELRLRLIENGLRRARSWTLERFANDLVGELAELNPRGPFPLKTEVNL